MDAQEQAGPLTAVFARNVNAAPCPCPVPQVYGVSTLDQLERGAAQRQDLVAPLLKLDYNFGDHSATTRLNFTKNETDGFTGFAGSQTFVRGRVESNFENFFNEGWAISQSLTSVFGPLTINEFRFSISQEKRPRRTRSGGPETVISDTGGTARHNEAVKETIPASQLLVFEVKDGWEPLCTFLGVPVPDEPFPRTNNREEFWDLVNANA